MAKAMTAPAAIVKLAEFSNYEVRFGKNDKVIKLPVTKLVGDSSPATDPAWKITDMAKETPDGVLFVGVDGQTFVADYRRYPAQTQDVCLFHGTKQKLGDEYAALESVDDCIEAVRELDAQLAEGKWFAERQGFAGLSILLRAIMQVYTLTEEKAREFLKPLTPKEKQGLRVCDELKGAIASIEAERGKGVDAKAILGKLVKPNGDPAGSQA